jgi:hypothetical protein
MGVFNLFKISAVYSVNTSAAAKLNFVLIAESPPLHEAASFLPSSR